MKLIDVFISVAIVAVLAVVTIPSYLVYLRSAEFSEAVYAAEDLKTSVAKCIERKATLKGCTQATNGIPAEWLVTPSSAGRTVRDGIITATAPTKASYGVANTTYILTPNYTTGAPITWTERGSGCVKNYTEC